MRSGRGSWTRWTCVSVVGRESTFSTRLVNFYQLGAFIYLFILHIVLLIAELGNIQNFNKIRRNFF